MFITIGDHLASSQLRLHKAGRDDVARRTETEDRFTGLDLSTRMQHAMRGAIGTRGRHASAGTDKARSTMSPARLSRYF